MADCTSERRNSLLIGAGAAILALLTGAVSGAGASSTKAGSSKTNSAKSVADKAGSAKVTSVHFWSLGDMTRISIEVSSEFKYRWDRLAEPDRLFFDIVGARPAALEKKMRTIPVGDSLLKQIRLAETQPGVTRVVLDLEAHEPQVAYTASQLSNPERLMVELRLAAPEQDKGKPAAPVTGSSGGSKILPDGSTWPATRGASGEPGSAARQEGAADFEAPSAASQLTKPDPSAKPGQVTKPGPVTPTGPIAKAGPVAKAAPVARAAPREFRLPPEDPSIPAPQPQTEQPKLEILAPPALGMLASVKPAPAIGNSRVVLAPPPGLQPAAPPPAPTKPRQEPLPAKANTNGDRSLTRALGLKLGRVVIDAGHGGNDAGTHGPSGLLEKDVTLDVALKLGALLQERLGTDVVYTRTDDTYIALEQRTQIANDRKADLFLSIHVNSSPYRTVGGVETYYLNFTTSKTALDLAAKENAGAQSTIFDLKEVLAKIAMKDKIDESREFASTVQNSLFAFSSKNNAAAKNRGIKKAPFVVLIGASMPSVLAEIGFLTNATDEALLKKPEQRQKIAEALYKGVASYADTLSHFQEARVAKRE
jgi:N-acetylmuramoyl-L-alanine amidase